MLGMKNYILTLLQKIENARTEWANLVDALKAIGLFATQVPE